MVVFVILGTLVGYIIYRHYKNKRQRERAVLNIDEHLNNSGTSSIKKVAHNNIAGVTKPSKTGIDRQKVIKNDLREGEKLVLEREPNNRYDDNAIRIYTRFGDDIGFVPRDTAAYLAPEMDQGREMFAKVDKITGGSWGKSTYGVNINIYKKL